MPRLSPNRVRIAFRSSLRRLERLEDRTVPSSYSWTGGPTRQGTNWFDANNWNLDSNTNVHAVPGAGDDAVISAPNVGDPSTVFISGSASVHSLNTTRTVQVTSGSLSLGSGVSNVSTLNLGANTLDIADGAQLSGGNYNGTGPFVEPAGRTLSLFAATFNMPITNAGTLVALYINSISGFTVNGPVTNQAGAVIRLQGGVTRLTNGLANHGTIELTSIPANSSPSDTTTLLVGGATFTNFSDGTVSAIAGSGGRREIDLNDNITLDNQGLVRTVGASLRLVSGSLPGSTFQTTGTVAIDAGQAISNPGSFFTFAYNGGTITGGTLDLSGGHTTLNLGANLSDTAVDLVLNGTTVNGPQSLTNIAGKTLTTTGTTFNCPVVNNGTLIQNSTDTGYDQFNGPFTSAVGSTIRFQATAGSGLGPTFATGFTNNGALIFDGNSTNNTVEVYINAGTMTNGPSGTITSTGGFGLHRFRFVGGTGFVNQGTLTLTGANFTLTNSSFSSPTFSNTGTITIGVGTTLSTELPFTNAAGGTLAGAGIVVGNLANAGTVSPGFSPGFLTLNGNYSQSSGGALAIELNGAAAGASYDQLKVNGSVSLAGALTLTSTIVAPLGAQFVLVDNDGTDAVTGTFTSLAQGATVTVNGTTYSISYTGGTGNDVVLTATTAGPLAGVRSLQINGGAAQRSLVTSLTVTFDRVVTFLNNNPTAAFTLTRSGGGTVGGLTAQGATVGGVTVVTISSFTGAETSSGSLVDGRFSLTALAANISANGQSLDGNSDGVAGGNYVLADNGQPQGLFRYYGDSNGDRTVDNSDFFAFRGTFLLTSAQTGYLAYFDFNNDGVVDNADFFAFRSRFLTGI